MRISDWSSDVCSSDLDRTTAHPCDQLPPIGDRHPAEKQYVAVGGNASRGRRADRYRTPARSEEHTSELQSLMRISYAVFCLKKKKIQEAIGDTKNEEESGQTI